MRSMNNSTRVLQIVVGGEEVRFLGERGSVRNVVRGIYLVDSTWMRTEGFGDCVPNACTNRERGKLLGSAGKEGEESKEPARRGENRRIKEG